MTATTFFGNPVDMLPDPNGVYALHVSRPIAKDEVECIARRWREAVGTTAKLVVLAHGMTLSWVAPGADESAGTPIYDALLAEMRPAGL